MHGYGAESTAAEAAAMTGDGGLDLFPGRNRLAIRWVRTLFKREGIDAVHFSLCQRERRWIAHKRPIAVLLKYRLGRPGILLKIGNPKCLRKFFFGGGYLFI